MKRYIVVAYDITDDRRREKICSIISHYGNRVNYSVFECFLKDKEIQKLKKKIEKYLKKDEDIILYYYLCKDCLEKIERVGNFSEERQVVKVI